jgi:hypothetical protein
VPVAWPVSLSVVFIKRPRIGSNTDSLVLAGRSAALSSRSTSSVSRYRVPHCIISLIHIFTIDPRRTYYCLPESARTSA